MRWHAVSGLKYYASAGIALVGLSAASTLLTDRVSLAQSPRQAATSQEDDAYKLELAEKILAETLGDDHPKLKEVRARLEAMRQLEKARSHDERIKDALKNQAKEKAESTRRVLVQGLPGGTPGAVTMTRVINENGEVVTEQVAGADVSVLGGEGPVVQDVLAKAVRGMSLLGNPKQNRELQKAVEKYKSKDASEQDKTAAKEKIVSILAEQFDEDMDQRSKQIADLEKKVATLKEQIEKRKGAKQRMIDLKLEMLMNESEGLGFPSSWQQPAGVSPLGAATFVPMERNALRVQGLPALVAPVAPVAPVPPVSPTLPPAP